MMAKQGVKGKICFVSSVLGYMGLLGYASYSPGKHALMGVFTCRLGVPLLKSSTSRLSRIFAL